MEYADTFPSQCYANRELSWLQFNQRVLEEAADCANPLMERLNFVSIFQSNLDEFYMVRVGMLMDTLDMGITDDNLGMTSAQQLSAVLERTRELLAQRDRLFKSLMQELTMNGVELCRFSALSDKTQAVLEKYFRSNVLPLLSPQIVGRKQPFPFLRNKSIYAITSLKSKDGTVSMGIVPCEDGVLPRLVSVPGEGRRFVLMEELILGFLPKVFARCKVEESVLVRLVRSADIEVDDSAADADDLLPEEYRKRMEKLIRRRKKLSPVKLEYKGRMSDPLRSSLSKLLGLSKKHMFAGSVPLDLSLISLLRDQLREDTTLFYPRRVPQDSPAVSRRQSVTEQIRRRDILLAYPYESIRPLLRLLREAGRDPEVVSIRISLYRVARNSKIIEALVDAAENGKDVTAVVELKARFDEENNIGWSRVLEDAGCRVIYGLEGMKVHAKLLLITRMHNGQVEYITHVGTGNYNEDTVRLYTDLSLLTARPDIGAEVAEVLTGLSMGQLVEHTEQLLVSPLGLRPMVLNRIDGEILHARSGAEAYLGFKLNGLTDKVIIDKLIEASRAGVHIDLLVRGICCLVGGVPGYTDNIRVCSIVGRYLEHSRIYIFGTQERRKVYISSADFMTRNTTRRVEVAAPILDEALSRRVEGMFFDQLRDTAKLRLQQPDGTYRSIRQDSPGLYNSQEAFAGRASASAPREEDSEEAPSGGVIAWLKKLFSKG